jgi:hypothetical protein
MEENTETASESIYVHALKFGALVGLAVIVLTVVFYVVDVTLLASFKFLALLAIIEIGLVIYFGINYRNLVGGFLPYSKALVHGFLCLAVAGIVGLLFQFLLYFVIDPDLPNTMTEAIIANTEAMMNKFGAPQESIDKAIAQMKDDLPKQFTAGGLAFSYVKALIFYAILSLITAIFVRKNEPVEM